MAASSRIPPPGHREWDQFFESCEAILGRPVSDREQQRCRRYLHHLLEWQRAFNLVAPADLPLLLWRHFLDSLTVFPLVLGVRNLGDLGSGAGFPGLVLAIFLPEEAKVSLLEANGKRCEFLRFVIHDLVLDHRVRVINQRLPLVGDEVGSLDCVVSRALGSVLYGAALALPLLAAGGYYMAMKGVTVQQDLDLFRRDPVSASYGEPEVIPLHTPPNPLSPSGLEAPGVLLRRL